MKTLAPTLSPAPHESLRSKPVLFRRCSAEALGTFFLVLVGPGAAVVDAATGALTHVGVSLAFGLVVLAMVFALSRISGAHINPAVTLALALHNQFPRSHVLSYIAAQLLGAILASLALRATFPDFIAAASTTLNYGLPIGLGSEFLLTFCLMFVICSVAATGASPGTAATAIGAAVALAALLGGPVTGASMNPARSFGPALVSGVWASHWVYWLAPFTGALCAGYISHWLRGTRAGGSGSIVFR